MTEATNISENMTIALMVFRPIKLTLASGYAASEASRICPKVAARVMNTVLNAYRQNGTQVVFIRLNSITKLSSVGWEGRIVGG